MRYAWIERHRSAYPVELMCQSLGVSKSGWYAARSRAPSQRDEENARLVTRMHSLQQRHRGRYGRRRMHRALREEVGVINEKRVGRLMRQHGLQSRLRRRFRVVTTDSRHAYPVAPNVLARDFEASAPDRKWLVDLTFVATDEGWLYLALVLDLFGRKFVGWAMSERIDEDLTLQALVMALEWRRPTGELMHHSDSNNVSTSFSTARPVTAVVGLPEGLVPRSVPDGLTHTLIDLICCLSPDPSAGREHRTARFHLAAACDPRRA